MKISVYLYIGMCTTWWYPQVEDTCAFWNVNKLLFALGWSANIKIPLNITGYRNTNKPVKCLQRGRISNIFQYSSESLSQSNELGVQGSRPAQRSIDCQYITRVGNFLLDTFYQSTAKIRINSRRWRSYCWRKRKRSTIVILPLYWNGIRISIEWKACGWVIPVPSRGMIVVSNPDRKLVSVAN